MKTWLVRFVFPLAASIAFNAVASLINALTGHPFAHGTIGWWAVAFSVCASSIIPETGRAA